MRQTHKAGEKCFLYYCGPTVLVINPQTGELRPLPKQHYEYVEIWHCRVNIDYHIAFD